VDPHAAASDKKAAQRLSDGCQWWRVSTQSRHLTGPRRHRLTPSALEFMIERTFDDLSPAFSFLQFTATVPDHAGHRAAHPIAASSW